MRKRARRNILRDTHENIRRDEYKSGAEGRRCAWAKKTKKSRMVEKEGPSRT